MRMAQEHEIRRVCGDKLWKFMESATIKRRTNLTVRADLIEAARIAGVNLSAIFEHALEKELVHARRRQWREANATSIEAYNRQVKTRGTFAQMWLRL